MCFTSYGILVLSSDRENEQKERKTELIKEIEIQNVELQMIEKNPNFASFEVIRIRRIDRLENSLIKKLNKKVTDGICMHLIGMTGAIIIVLSFNV